MKPILMTCHSKRVGKLARSYGWLVGARYTNLRDIREFSEIGLIDIDWKNYDFDRHLNAVKKTSPLLTIARDIEDAEECDVIFAQAKLLARYAKHVCIVPKDLSLKGILDSTVPKEFFYGYSTPTKYGGTEIPLEEFNRPTHILGGRPDVQKSLAKKLPVFSLDVNRFTFDAKFGDYFDGKKFCKHPIGGYDVCLEASISNITKLWEQTEELDEKAA